MERLTERTADGILVKENYEKESLKTLYSCYGEKPNSYYSNCEEGYCAMEKLADYEDAEEQGRLIKLPCKVGDTVWDNDFGRPCAYTITAFSFGECEEYICKPVTTKEAVFYYENSSGSITGSFAESAIGKSVFLNKSEAEAKLKELRGGENESSNLHT